MEIIDKTILESLTTEAHNNSRKRKNKNYHSKAEDLIQRMLNAFEPGTYVRPHVHKNPDKREVFIVLTGKLLVIFFNAEGIIIDHVILNKEDGVFAVEIKPGEWHTATGLETGTVVYEIKDGPYDVSEDKNFAGWSPEEGVKESEIQLNKWLVDLGISI